MPVTEETTDLDTAIGKLAAENEKASPKARRVELSAEMAAVVDIEAILRKLSPKSAGRVMDWVNDSMDDS